MKLIAILEFIIILPIALFTAKGWWRISGVLVCFTCLFWALAANAEDKPIYLCTSKTHATIVGRKAEACPTYVTERKTRAQLRQTMQRALGMYGKREVEGALRSYVCEWK